MIKRFFFIFLLLLCFNYSLNYITSYAAPAVNAEDLDNLEGDGKYLGNTYRDNYYLDIEKTDIFEAGDYMLNQIANALFSIIRILGFTVSVFFYRVMIFDVSDVFSTEINSIQSALKSSIFDAFFILAFAASAWTLMKKVTRRDLAGLVAEIGKILCIFLLASFVVTNSATALSSTTSMTKDISVSALMNINQQGNVEVRNYAANAAGMIWKSLVHAPWKSLEFEGGSDDESNIEEFLTTKPGTDERATLVETYKTSYPTAMLKTMGVGRIGFLIVYLIPFLVKSCIYMFMAILQLAFQVMAVFYILLAPVILLLALVPAFGGIELVSSWLKKILETQIMMLIITFILGIIISLDNFLYAKSGEYGWFIVIFMETLVALVIVVNHKSILSGLSKMTAGVRQPATVKTQLQQSGDVFGALGSGNGIRNLSPTKRYIDKMNDKKHYDKDKSDTHHNLYGNNYQHQRQYNKYSDIPEQQQYNNAPPNPHSVQHDVIGTNIPKTYKNMPVQKTSDLPEKHEIKSIQPKVIRPNFLTTSTTKNNSEGQLHTVKPILAKQPNIVTQKISTSTNMDSGNNSNKKPISTEPSKNINTTSITVSNADKADKAVNRPISSVKPKDELKLTATTATAYKSVIQTQYSQPVNIQSGIKESNNNLATKQLKSYDNVKSNNIPMPTDKPVKPVPTKQPDIVTQKISASTNIDNVNNSNRPLSTNKNINYTRITKDNTDRAVDRPIASVKSKDMSEPEPKPITTSSVIDYNKLADTSHNNMQKQNPNSSIPVKKEHTENRNEPSTKNAVKAKTIYSTKYPKKRTRTIKAKGRN